MQQEDKSFLEAFEEKKTSSTLNVLTILTFIGCGLEFILNALSFGFLAKYSFNIADRYLNQGNPDNLPSAVGNSYTPEVYETLRKTYEYRLPIFLLALAATTLCLIGALKMRKQKADGYWLWLVGELLPYFGILIFIGTGTFAKPVSFLILIFPLTFIALYTSQRKHLS